MGEQEYNRFTQPLGAGKKDKIYCNTCENAVYRDEGDRFTLLYPCLGYCKAYKRKPEDVFEWDAPCEKYVRLTSKVATREEVWTAITGKPYLEI
ncbi:MAG: hypothetical protein J6332_03815 [Abditibacteriota bacterium]|nr:hypothetical protein [Abditibacteriota bacterium]